MIKDWFLGMHEVKADSFADSGMDCPDYVGVRIDEETCAKIKRCIDFIDREDVTVQLSVDSSLASMEFDYSAVDLLELTLSKHSVYLDGEFKHGGFVQSNVISMTEFVRFIESEDQYRFDVPDLVGNTELTEETKENLIEAFGSYSEREEYAEELRSHFQETALLTEGPSSASASNAAPGL